jgi:putative aldouronate transport system permease protein
VFQTIVYIPNFISWVIMAGILTDILGSTGIVNEAIMALGGKPVQFISNRAVFPWTMIFSDMWKTFGFGTVVYLATMTSIDPELYESAVIDGAGRWRQTWSITLPMLVPIIILMTVLALGNVLSAGFDQIYNLYSPAVWETADIIDTYVYRLGIQQAQYSVGAAVGLFKSLVSAIMVIVSYRLADKLAGYRIL